MNGMLRAMKYASFRAARVIGITVLMAVGFVFYFAFLNDDAFTVPNLVGRFPVTLIFVGNLMISLYGMLDVVTYMQLTLCYGSTRKYAIISQIYMGVVQVAAVVLILAASCALIPESWQYADGSSFVLIAQNLMFFGSGLALFGGLLIYRFGRVAYWIFVMLMACGGGVLAGFGGYADEGALQAVSRVAMSYPALQLLGVLWFAVMAAACWLILRRSEVHV